MKRNSIVPVLLGAILLLPATAPSQELRTPLTQQPPATGYEGARLDRVTLLPVNQGPLVIGGTSKHHRPQLLFFFTTYCQYCEKTVAAINAARQKLSGDDAMPVVGVSLSPIEATKEFATRTGAAFPIGVMESILPMRNLGISAVPAVALVNASGELTFSRVGVVALHTSTAELYDAYMAATKSGR